MLTETQKERYLDGRKRWSQYRDGELPWEYQSEHNYETNENIGKRSQEMWADENDKLMGTD